MDLNRFSTFNVILVILLIVYSLIMFLLFNPIFFNFRISFGFTLIAFILQFVLMYYLNRKLDSTKIANFSVFFVADVYLFFQIILSIIFNIVFFNITLAIIVQLLFLAITIIVELLLIQTKDYIDEVEVKKENQIKFQKNALKKVEILKQKYPNCKELENLYETVRFSNPMSNNEVNNLESNILENLNSLKEFLNGNDKENSLNKIKSIIDDFNERDIILSHWVFIIFTS